jgi:hypothetical protein
VDSGEAKSGAAVTARTILEREVASKRSFAVVAGGTVHAASGKVLGGGGRANLARLRRAGCEAMAISAIQSFASPVLRMAKRVTERARICRRAAVGLFVMAHSAGA